MGNLLKNAQIIKNINFFWEDMAVLEIFHSIFVIKWLYDRIWQKNFTVSAFRASISEETTEEHVFIRVCICSVENADDLKFSNSKLYEFRSIVLTT